MTKHFPGGGPQMDGEDAHFPHGREQVYPGGQFELHLKPFEAAFEAGTSQIMPYYGMPVGTEYEEVGFGFNKSVITGLLRERYGFDGIVCTDWGLISDSEIFGQPFPARAWGVEHLTPRERMVKVIEAGVDQFGGEAIPELLIELVESGEISEARLDESARRLLREKFVLGLFDAPLVDVAAAGIVVGSEEFRAAGEAAQRASITVLTNTEITNPVTDAATPALPIATGLKLYVEGIDAAVAAEYGTVVATPAEADVAIIRTHAPFEVREHGVRELLPPGLARLHRRGRRAPARGRGIRAHHRRRAPRSPGHPHADPRLARSSGRGRRELRSERPCSARCAHRRRGGEGQAALRPAVEHGRRRGQPRGRAVRHEGPAVPLRARVEHLTLR